MTSKPWYLGVYVTNSTESRKSCNTVLLFGGPNWRGNNPNRASMEFSWKYISLPCPTCGFDHLFKRSEWNEAHEFKTMGDYTSET